MRNIRFKVGKLAPKFIRLFKILKYIREAAYELEMPSLYGRLHPVFYVSLLEEYILRKGKELEYYIRGIYPEFTDEDKD